MDTKALLDTVLAEIPKPKTWGQLADIIDRLIDVEPKRLRMNNYLCNRRCLDKCNHAGAPACGTAGCWIGWGGGGRVYYGPILNNGPEQLATLLSRRGHTRTPEYRAFAVPLWSACYDFENYRGIMSGTREYADQVLKVFGGIRERYRTEMDITSIEVGP